MVAYRYNVSDQSPAINYSPYRDGDMSSGWTASYTLQSQVKWTQDTLGPGISSHNTTASGAMAILNFTGTDACAIGDAARSDFDLLCDGSPTNVSYPPGYMACCGNLSMGMHSITLKATSPFLSVVPLGLMGFNIRTELPSTGGASIIEGSVSAGRNRSRSLAELGAKWYLPQAAGDTAEDIITAVLSGHHKPRPKSRKARAERYHDKGLQARQTVYGDSSWQTAGEWYIDSRIGGGGGSMASWYPRIVTNSPMAILIFTVPANISLGAILGSVDWNQGVFQVQAWPDQDYRLASKWQTFNASSRWASLDQIKFLANFDPYRTWQVAVANIGPTPHSYWDMAEFSYVLTSDHVDPRFNRTAT